MLNVLVRTLRDLALFDAGAAPPPAKPEDDDPVPKDMDEFRNELARRIRGFIENEKREQEKAAAPDVHRGAIGTS